MKGLATGLGPTAVGYFIQGITMCCPPKPQKIFAHSHPEGWFKFGGVEFFKIQAAQALGDESAWKNRNMIYLGK